MRPSEAPLISAGAVQARVRTLAREVSADYRGASMVLLVVLKGALPFATDLVGLLETDFSLEYIRAKSYFGTEPGSELEFLRLPDAPLTGRHVLVIEDILATGLTAGAILDWTEEQCPASVRLCTLLDKPKRRQRPVAAAYTGFAIEDRFVVGYGMDYNEQYRQLPDIRILEGVP